MRSRDDRRSKAKAGASPTAYKLAMRQVASPVAIIAAGLGDDRNGLTATAVCSASADPPTLLICVNRDATAHELIEDSGAFSVNFLNVDQSSLARLFSTPKLSSEERFAEGVWKPGVTGAPLLEGALSVFDCQVVQTHKLDTHTIFLGRVCEVVNAANPPLLYSDGFFRRLATD